MMHPAVLFLALVAAVVAMSIAVAVGHGVLKPLCEARGITPWTLRDSVGSLMLVLIGSGLLAGSLSALVAARLTDTANVFSVPLLFYVLCLALPLIGALMMRLGLLALRKLT
jgi:hypothetical protein